MEEVGPWPHGRSCVQKGCGQVTGVWPFPEWEEHAQRAGTMPKEEELCPEGMGICPQREVHSQ